MLRGLVIGGIPASGAEAGAAAVVPAVPLVEGAGVVCVGVGEADGTATADVGRWSSAAPQPATNTAKPIAAAMPLMPSRFRWPGFPTRGDTDLLRPGRR